MIPKKISPQPTYPIHEILSIPKITPPIALNADSVDITMVAKVGSARLCAMTCKVYATPTDNIPQYRIDHFATKIPLHVGSSNKNILKSPSTAQTANCPQE